MVAPSPTNNGLVNEINTLKNEIYSLSNIDNVSQAILDLKGDCLTIHDKLDEKKSGKRTAELSPAFPLSMK